MQPRFDFRPVTSAGERSHLEELQGLVLGKDPAAPPLPLQGLRTTSMSILAYLEGRKRPVGAVTVVDTTKDALSRLIYGIPPIYGSTAFYGGMMVLPEYRGWAIPVRLIFQAQRLFVNELGIRSTWLLYPQERIAGARLTTIMKYRPLSETFNEAGCANRVLIREEPRGQRLKWDLLPVSSGVSARRVTCN